MKKTIWLGILFGVLLVACGGREEATPTATPEPTAVPEPTAMPEPTVAPAPTAPAAENTGSPIDAMDHVPDPELINKAWVWERRDPNGNPIDEIVVPNPADYALFFNETGEFFAKLDCNNMQGRYATARPEDIFMEGGVTTMVFCGEDSLDTEMSKMFGPAQAYRFEEDGQVLVFGWVAGGPIDYFRQVAFVELSEPAAEAPTGTVIAPDGVFLRTGPGTHYPYVGAAPYEATGEIIGVSQDGGWWLVDAPNQPGGQVWVSATFVTTTNAADVPVVTAAPIMPSLTGTPWLWMDTTDPATGTQPVTDFANYVVLFNEDGTANIQADCNNILATYTTDGSSISLELGPSTMVFCGEGSLDVQFLEQLSSVVLYFIEGSNLYMDLPVDSGTMRFAPEGMAAPPVEDPPAGEANGSTLYLRSFGPTDAPQPLVAGSQITANFAGDQISGSAGCNNYSGTLVPVSDYFNVTDILTTRQFCEGLMEQEQAYLVGLQAITGYQWEQTLVGSSSIVTQGQIFYTLPDGTSGVMNFASSP